MPNDGDILKESQPNDVEVSAQVQLDKVSHTGDFLGANSGVVLC